TCKQPARDRRSRSRFAARPRSLGHDDERISLLDDVGGELRSVALADVPHGVNRLRGDEEDVAVVLLKVGTLDAGAQRDHDVSSLLTPRTTSGTPGRDGAPTR